MSGMYHDCHRRLQDEHDTRALADRHEALIVHEHLLDDERAFIETRDMLFLSTVDPAGCPTVSYKGGDIGFVRIVDGEIVIPSYDGNGMFLSLGNATVNPKVGLLFIDFERPRRLRVQGIARHDAGDAKASFPGAVLLTRVRPTAIFVNCPRYVNRYQRQETSRYVPDGAGQAPMAQWKRLGAVKDVLPERDRRAAEEAGELLFEDYIALVAKGEG